MGKRGRSGVPACIGDIRLRWHQQRCRRERESVSGKLSLVAYSTPQEAYEEIIPAFQKTPDGKGVEFEQSYGASGDQSRAVEAGLPADFVAFSLEPDMTRLVDAGLVDADWNQTSTRAWSPTRSSSSSSARATPRTSRPGTTSCSRRRGDHAEPVHVRRRAVEHDGRLRRPDQAGQAEEEAIEYLRELSSNVAVQDKSAREALQTFIGGKGDVLLAYENEAIAAQQKGEDIDYVVPDQTILIENPVAVTTDAPERRQAFVDFLYADEAQKIFGDNGYRPVVDVRGRPVRLPDPAGLFTIADLGGWDEVKDEFFDPENGIVAEIERTWGSRLSQASSRRTPSTGAPAAPGGASLGRGSSPRT